MNPMQVFLVGLCALAALAAAPARAAFIFPTPAIAIPVVEYHNTLLDHYFLTSDSTEMTVVDNGQAGPGWVRTGNAFYAFAFPNASEESCPSYGCGVMVARFYGTPGLGPNSHFYTLVAAEIEGLKQPLSLIHI